MPDTRSTFALPRSKREKGGGARGEAPKALIFAPSTLTDVHVVRAAIKVLRQQGAPRHAWYLKLPTPLKAARAHLGVGGGGVGAATAAATARSRRRLSCP